MYRYNKRAFDVSIYALLIAAFSLISCNSAPENLLVFKYNLVNHPNSLDPAFSKSLSSVWISGHIFNTLVETNESSQIIGSLAKSWEISEDGLEYTFHLNPDVYFHHHPQFGSDSTRTVEASDVVYSLNRIVDPKVNSPGAWIFKDKLASANAFEAKDEHTFVLRLKKPFRPLLSILTMPYCSIIPKEIVDFYGLKWKDNPIGTGPYKFKKWIKNQNLFLSPNENFWRARGNLDGIKINFIVDHKIAYLELLNGNLDFVTGLESSFINEMLTADGELQPAHQEKIKYLKAAYLNTEYIGINLEMLDPSEPLANADFRKALNYALDKKTMLKTLRNNVGHAANSAFTPMGLSSFDSTKAVGYSFDLEKAKLQLKISGVNPESMEPLTIYTNPPYADIMLFVAKQWEQLGIMTNLEVVESSILREGMRNGTVKLFRASWIGDYLDSENFMSVFYGANSAPPNYTRFNNETFDELYQRSNLENSNKLRDSIFQKMDRIIIEECPLIFLFYDQSSNFYSNKIKNIRHNLSNQPFVDLLSKEL